MELNLSIQLRKIVHWVGQINWLRKILTPVHKLYIKRSAVRRNRSFLKNGMMVFKEFDSIMLENGINYSVFYGTLLGAIREQGLIKHDMDFDVCIWAEEYSSAIESALNANGFKLNRRFEVENGVLGREETYSKSGVDIDIFYIYSDSNYPSYTCCFKPANDSKDLFDSVDKYGYVAVRRMQMPVSRELIRIPFENIEVNAIANYDEFLKKCYGTNYMVPDPNYKPIDGDETRFEWPNVFASFKKF